MGKLVQSNWVEALRPQATPNTEIEKHLNGDPLSIAQMQEIADTLHQRSNLLLRNREFSTDYESTTKPLNHVVAEGMRKIADAIEIKAQKNQQIRLDEILDNTTKQAFIETVADYKSHLKEKLSSAFKTMGNSAKKSKEKLQLTAKVQTSLVEGEKIDMRGAFDKILGALDGPMKTLNRYENDKTAHRGISAKDIALGRLNVEVANATAEALGISKVKLAFHDLGYSNR